MTFTKGIIVFFLLIIFGTGIYMLGASNAVWTAKPLVVPLVTPLPVVTPQVHGNPASIYCTQVNGTLTIQEDGSGNQYRLCTFEDNRACEEAALYAGDCPVGGVKTTGYVTDAQKYCAWLGGKTNTSITSCTFPDGSVCNTNALFNRTCHKGDK